MFRSCQTVRSHQAIVKRRRREWRQLSKDRQTRRPAFDLFQRAISNPCRVVVHAEDKGSHRIDVSRARRFSTVAYSAGLLKLLFMSLRFAVSIDSMPMNTHLPSDAAIKSTSSSSRNRLALICAIQGTCAFGSDDVA